MGKGRFIVNPFTEMQISPNDRLQLQDLANGIIMTNLDNYNTFVSSGKRKVDLRRWKQIKEREKLTVYAERPESANATTNELSGSGLPMILCVGQIQGKLEDLMYGVLSEDLETMRVKASYVDDVSGAAVLDPIVLPTLEDPFQSLIVKWMELDIPFASTSFVKNRDYVYLEGTGFVTSQSVVMGKGRFIVNPFPEMHITPNDRLQLQDLANDIIMSNLEKYNTFVSSGKRMVDARRWKQIKTRERLAVFAERPETVHSTGSSDLTGSGLPMILCVGTMEGKLEDLMYGVLSEDLETMRLKASYVDDVSGAAVLDPIVVPTLEDPFQSLIVKWMELDIPFASTNLVKNRDYVYVEGTGFVTSQNGERLGYHLLHSVSFPQTHELPNRIRGNVSIIGFWRQSGPNTMEIYATGIFDPCGDMIRMLVVPGMASAFLSSVKYANCGQMRKLSFMLDKAYSDSKLHGTPNKKNVCVTCSASITGRRLGDFAKSNSSCKLCFGHVCHSCKVVQKLSFVDPDLLLSKRKVTFCTACISSVTRMSAMDVARAKMLSAKKGVGYASTNTSSTLSGEFDSEVSYSSSTDMR
ncbi:Hypothetical protein PHPALM_6281 [Phytophthora palmivora]|uniref:FYVE-type domain-containing protein n=1 Tax=Phytophthora palmivora TaxID=4796 RepID=A0A2P4YF89_9STRA|nr:Hypothetical protein PHPALM_6281 [Phytophthora palmivora]